MSVRVVVASIDALTPLACGVPVVVSAGQIDAQEPVQVGVIPVSGLYRYRVRPDPSTRIWPSDELAVFTVAAALLEVGGLVATGEVEVPELLQPAATAPNAPAPTAKTTSRFMVDSVECDRYARGLVVCRFVCLRPRAPSLPNTSACACRFIPFCLLGEDSCAP